MAETETNFVDKYAKTARAALPAGAMAAAVANDGDNSQQQDNLRKKSVTFSTIKNVSIGLASAVAAAAIGSTIQESLIQKALKGPSRVDVIKKFSNFIGVGIAGIFSLKAFENFQNVQKHNKEVEAARQDRGRG